MDDAWYHSLEERSYVSRESKRVTPSLSVWSSLSANAVERKGCAAGTPGKKHLSAERYADEEGRRKTRPEGKGVYSNQESRAEHWAEVTCFRSKPWPEFGPRVFWLPKGPQILSTLKRPFNPLYV